jgi:hypothetical protein
MKIPQSVGAILRDHVRLELACVDRLYLNVYVPQLQYAGGVATFLKHTHQATDRRYGHGVRVGGK